MPEATFKRFSSSELTDWHDHECWEFFIGKWQSHVVVPQTPAKGRPWIWRTLFWDAWPQVDLALVEQGWHVGYVDNIGLYGNDKALDLCDTLYGLMVDDYGLSPKPCLEGFSRGALTAYRWAAANPDKTLCVYADAPVCDIRSWPGGKGKGIGSPECWHECLKMHGLTEATSNSFEGNPIDRLKPLAEKNIPLIHVYGDADDVVPHDENTLVLAERYKELGGRIELIAKPGVGHHPHSLEDPTPVVNFIMGCVKR